MRCSFLYLTCSSLFILFPQAFGDRIRDRIYHVFNADAFSACFRRLNGTAEVGCQSFPGGNVGALHYIQDQTDLDYVIRDGAHEPYIPVINANQVQFFNTQTFRDFERSKRVTGIIIIRWDTGVMTESFSGDKTCPNEGYGLGGSCKDVEWNPVGNALLYQKWDMPIFLLLQNEDIDYLLTNCTLKFNSGYRNGTVTWPLCSAELKSYMLAAEDSPTCIRRSNLVTNLSPQSRCDALGDFNVWTPLEAVARTEKVPNETIIIAARMDAVGLFDVVPGADSAVTGVVTLMLILDALVKSRPELRSKRIFFVLFNGESFDYIGSSRVVFDISRGQFPYTASTDHNIDLAHIDIFIELSQLGAVFQNNTVYIHSDPQGATVVSTQAKINKFAKLMAEEAINHGMNAEFLNFAQQLPPSSLHSFLRADRTVPGVVIADHKHQYQNPFYNSFFDTARNWNSSYPENITLFQAYNHSTIISESLTGTATIVARSLYRYITDNSTATEIEADKLLSANLWFCCTNQSYCPLWIRYFDSKDQSRNWLKGYPLKLYIGANNQASPATPAFVAWRTLAALAGERLNVSKSDCKGDRSEFYTYAWINDYDPDPDANQTGHCVRSQADVSEARSPAHTLEDYSGKYPVWTESVWQSTSIRVFVQPNPQDDINILTFGLVFTFVATVVIFFLNRSARDIFHVTVDET